MITDMPDMERRQYLQILYDRDHLLPRAVDLAVLSHVQQVAKGLRSVPRRGERRLPRLDLNLDADSPEAGAVSVINFNYKYIMLDWRADLPDRLTLELPGGIRFACARDTKFNDAPRGEPLLYLIEDWEELADDEQFRDFIMERVLGRVPEKTLKMLPDPDGDIVSVDCELYRCRRVEDVVAVAV
jgi:cellulose synthase (UDP-forming)